MSEEELREIEERITRQRHPGPVRSGGREDSAWDYAAKLLFEVRRLRSLFDGIVRWDG